jgi:hypothetical protein
MRFLLILAAFTAAAQPTTVGTPLTSAIPSTPTPLGIPVIVAGTVTFSPQQVSGKSAKLTLWSVDAMEIGRVSVPAAQIYSLAAAHKVGHVDLSLVTNMQAHSPWSIAVQVLGIGSGATSLGTMIKDGGFVSDGTAAKVQNVSGAVAVACAIALPYVQKAQAAFAPNPAITARILTGDLVLVNGSGSALFYSLPSNVGPFTEVLR